MLTWSFFFFPKCGLWQNLREMENEDSGGYQNPSGKINSLSIFMDIVGEKQRLECFHFAEQKMFSSFHRKNNYPEFFR